MPRKTRTPKKPRALEHIPSQLDRIERKVDRLVARVDNVERRASIWGAVSAAVVALTTHLAGCL